MSINKRDVLGTSTPGLEQAAEWIRAELRRREINLLLKQECTCDRYTCQRCQGLQRLNHRSEESPDA